ncbi:Lon protease-like protein, mitochondrial [Mycena indigotica]|uniref:Lon protease homolog, mitochondrial n=1 Tax=Mycena indigotica TaxID=2126181 RepID=A0A8H6SB47_9AGAR|nr:Lon protease-like protein, mitochondrial [Mycena indigotica]KAF7295717.1 Lon protease-like protein, mitochondrial [Mycena indigotica]
MNRLVFKAAPSCGLASSALWRPASTSRVTLDLLRGSFSHQSRSKRGFASTTTVFAQPTRVARYPRWINDKGHEEGAEKPPVKTESENDEGRDESSGSSGERDPSDSSSSSDSPPPSDSSSDPPPSAPPSSSSRSPPPNTLAKQSIPENYPLVLALPIARRPLFPGFYKAVVIRNPAVVAAVKDMMRRGQPYLGAFLLKDENADSDIVTDLDSIHKVGVFAQITSVFAAVGKPGPNGEPEEEGLTAVLYPHRRVVISELHKPGLAQLEPAPEDPQSAAAPENPSPPAETQEAGPVQTSFLHNHPISLASITNLSILPFAKDAPTIRALTGELINVFKDVAQLNPMFRDQITNFSINQVSANIFDEPDRLADFAAAVSSGSVQELQDVLESLDVADRLQKALLVLKKELINAQLQSKLSRDVDSKLAKRQREYYLMEQLKNIKKELGMESDGKDKLLDKFRERAAKLKMPEVAKKVFEEEMNKLAGLEPAASEANVTRNYLDWITQIPWGSHTPENFSLKHAQGVLDADHYGLADVKDRILEFLAVGKLRGTLGSTTTTSSGDTTTPAPNHPKVQGKILLLTGPPGVGKTSIGKSIARALGRQFFRFSVGGLTDIAEIKGHRRTYVGALPGKIIQALKRVGTSNPLVLIDEVDKIGRGINGDPASALLEMLDPEQNDAFLDHYMDIPVDLSSILFVCTANTLSTIPAPLLDRMEVIEVSGYVTEEKSAIASRYLVPQAKESSGLSGADVAISPEAVAVLIQDYCRESGVRGLKKAIEKIYRKAALNIVRDLGEDVFPEPAPEKPVNNVESTTPSPNEPSTVPVDESDSDSDSESDSDSDSDTEAASPKPQSPTPSETTAPVTTQERKPLPIPDTVHVLITPENLKEYMGPPVYQKDRMYDDVKRKPPPGVSTGLGYLGNGSGAVMPIEVVSMPGRGGLQLTGKLGEVIRESAQIGLSWVKSHADVLGITPPAASLSSASEDGKAPVTTTALLLDNRDIHVHMPEGSIGKDGPSAGTAIVSAFVSLFTKTRISSDIAMTGEISLVGQVLPVGGLKEKILAAHRAGIKTIVAPAANKADIEENVPASVKEGIRLVYVEDVKEVLHEVFKGEPIVERWKETMPLEQEEEAKN